MRLVGAIAVDAHENGDVAKLSCGGASFARAFRRGNTLACTHLGGIADDLGHAE